jgi:hypothetical protein
MPIGAVIVLLVVVLLWVAAVVFGRDSRDGGDWLSRTSIRDRSPRSGD